MSCVEWHEFKELAAHARLKISSAKDALVAQFLHFMETEFEPKVDELLGSIQEKQNDANELEIKISEAVIMLAWIADYKEQLEYTTKI